MIALMIVMIADQRSYACEEPQLLKMRSTAYCLQGITCTGKEVRPGICASGNKDLIGKTLILYQRLPDGSVGRMLGILECEDTGCSEYVIDTWMPDLEWCQEWMNLVYEDGCQGKIYVQVVEESYG